MARSSTRIASSGFPASRSKRPCSLNRKEARARGEGDSGPRAGFSSRGSGPWGVRGGGGPITLAQPETEMAIHTRKRTKSLLTEKITHFIDDTFKWMQQSVYRTIFFGDIFLQKDFLQWFRTGVWHGEQAAFGTDV